MKKVVLRLPKDFLAQLALLAHDNRHSLQCECLRLIAWSLRGANRARRAKVAILAGSRAEARERACPDGHHWYIDNRASNCTKKDDDVHRCWVRHGRPEDGTLHVDKSGNTCAAGAGSIDTGTLARLPSQRDFAHMSNFVPRRITSDMAADGYNNQGKGTLLGYIANPDEHETTCRYRISTGGDRDKEPHDACTCRIGLWREPRPSQRVVAEMRNTAKRAKKVTKPKAKKPASKPKKRARR